MNWKTGDLQDRGAVLECRIGEGIWFDVDSARGSCSWVSKLPYTSFFSVGIIFAISERLKFPQNGQSWQLTVSTDICGNDMLCEDVTFVELDDWHESSVVESAESWVFKLP